MAGTISSPAPGMISSPARGMIGGPGQVKPPKPPRQVKPGKPPRVNAPGAVGSSYGYGAASQNPSAHQPPAGITTQAAPQAAPAAPATPAAPPASPLDSTYFNNLAANQLKVGGQINSLTAQGQNSTTALQAALGQLAYQQPRDQLKLEQGANRSGALYSSAYDQNLGNLNNTYLTRQSGLTSANAQKQAAIAAQIAGLQQGEPIFAGEQYDAAVARAAKAAAANPATGQAAAVPTPTPAAPAVLASAPRSRPPVPTAAPRPEGRTVKQAPKKGRK